jgi:hypothetical protein
MYMTNGIQMWRHVNTTRFNYWERGYYSSWHELAVLFAQLSLIIVEYE